MPDMDALVRHWNAVSDDALLEAAEQLDEFTDEGRSVVVDELRRRGLAVPPPEPPERGDPSVPIEEVEVWRGNGMIQAQPVLAVLRANGIAARTRGEAAGRIYGLTLDGLGEIGILVRADRADDARTLLAAAEDGSLTVHDAEVDGGEGPAES